MKRSLILLTVLALLLAFLTACGGTKPQTAAGETVTFTDSAGRQVQVPAEITRVAPSGAVATMFLASMRTE